MLAALTLRSWTASHTVHCHPLIPRSFRPLGPARLLHLLQVWVENASSTSSNHTPASAHLYSSMVRNVLHPASSTDLASRVLARAEAFTLPTKIPPLALTRRVLSLCKKSLRRFAILA